MAKDASISQKAAVEALGTFLLVFLGAGAIMTSTFFFPSAASSNSTQLLIAALAHGIALALAVTIALGISGGHINPAVTISMLVTKRISAANATVYILAQVFGAIVGAALLLAFPTQAGVMSAWGAPTVSPFINVWQAIVIEAAITFVLVIAVFGTVVDKRSPKIAGFGVGLALMLGILVAGPYTGAMANPARAFGPELLTLNFSFWYVYWIGPILGAVIAALFYEYFVLGKK